jgi:hypothetical protein
MPIPELVLPINCSANINEEACIIRYGQHYSLVDEGATSVQPGGVGTDHRGDLTNTMGHTRSTTQTKGFTEDGTNDL